MRFIPASDIFVEKLRQAAKKTSRLKKIKLGEAQDRVARAYGFNHWNHVTQCQKATAQRLAAGEFASADLVKPSNVNFLKEVDYILGLASAGESRAVALERCVLFSTDDGDAWVLDADDGLALCLSWHGQRQDFVIEENEERFFVGYDAGFMLREGAFVVRSDNPIIGCRTIFGYPAHDLADLFENIRRRRAT